MTQVLTINIIIFQLKKKCLIHDSKITVFTQCIWTDKSDFVKCKPWSDCSLRWRLIWIYIAFPPSNFTTVIALSKGHNLRGYGKCFKISKIKWLQKRSRQTVQIQTNSLEAVWSGPSMFAILTSILWISALITNILFENRKGKVFEILEYFLKNISWKKKIKKFVLELNNL